MKRHRYKYVNINFIKNKYSKFELSRRINNLVRKDKIQKTKSVIVVQNSNRLKNKKSFFIHEDLIHLITKKNNKSCHDSKSFFVTVRICNGEYGRNFYLKFLDEFKKIKPKKNVEFVIETSNNDNHLHFIIDISKNELVKTIKKIINTNYFSVLKYVDKLLNKEQKCFFRKSTTNVPIFIEEVDDYINLVAYLNKQNNLSTYGKN